MLTLTSGNMIDYGRIEADVRAGASGSRCAISVSISSGRCSIAGALANDGLPARI